MHILSTELSTALYVNTLVLQRSIWILLLYIAIFWFFCIIQRMMQTKQTISPIEYFLLHNPEYNALEVLIPENVALCIYNDKLVHINVDECNTLVDFVEME